MVNRNDVYSFTVGEGDSTGKKRLQQAVCNGKYKAVFIANIVPSWWWFPVDHFLGWLGTTTRLYRCELRAAFDLRSLSVVILTR